MKTPTVFISYSHDSPEHADRVLELSNRLRTDGIDCTIDQYEISPPEGWPKWMDRQIADSDFVLVVCTEIYHRRVMGKEEKSKGLGVKWESTIAFQDIYDAGSLNTKFIPILFDEDNVDFIPKLIKGTTRYIILEQYEDLYRHLTSQPKMTKPVLGTLKKLDTLVKLERKTDFFEGTTAAWYLAHPYPMPPNFTGRANELKMLDNWLENDTNRLFILRALGGFGKSALSWQWINTHVNPTEWTKLVFWSFYEGDASFEHFIEETLKYLKLEVPPGQRPQVDELLKAMQRQKILLIMDGFERALRAYSSMNAAYQGDEEPKLEDNQLDCVNINAEIFLKSICSLPNIKSKALMTTRLTPRPVKPYGEFLQGCREEELTAMHKDDAVEFFHKQKIKGTHAEVESACATYGYHPLSLRLLAGRILKDFENPADIVVAQNLKINGDIKQHQYHVLEVSYNNLPPYEQKLLSTIACFRSPVELRTLESITENKDIFANSLQDLRERGLFNFDEKNKKFDLHPIVRQYTYERLSSDERLLIHSKLKNHFAHLLPTKAEKNSFRKQIVSIEDLQNVIEVYHHTTQMRLYDDAFTFYQDRLATELQHLGAFDSVIKLLTSLFSNDSKTQSLLIDILSQARVFHLLAESYRRLGSPIKAIELLELELNIRKNFDDNSKISAIMRDLAYVRLSLGKLNETEKSLQYGISILNSTDFEGIKRGLHRKLGVLYTYTGMYTKAKKELETVPLNKNNYRIIDSGTYLLFHKEWAEVLSKVGKAQKEAYKFRRNTSIITSEMLLGAAYLGLDDFIQAEQHLNIALINCRIINFIESEAAILLYVARLRYAQKNYEEAKSLVDEALTITERCGYVLQGADVNLFLAQYALEQENDKAKAKEYAQTALKLATCDGGEYKYKVAYDEAEAMLEKLS